MKESTWQNLLLCQQDKIEDLEFKITFLSSNLSDSSKRELDSMVESRRKVIKKIARERDEDALLRASQITKQKEKETNE